MTENHEPLGTDPDGTTDVAHPSAEVVEGMTEEDVITDVESESEHPLNIDPDD